MTLERAIEILDPDRGERFDDRPESLAQVNEACRMACEVMRKKLDEEKKREARRSNYERMRAQDAAQVLKAFDSISRKNG